MNFIFMAYLVLFIASCTDQLPAPIIYGTSNQETLTSSHEDVSTQVISPEDEIISQSSGALPSSDQDKISGNLKAPKNKQQEYIQLPSEEPKQVIYHEAQAGETLYSIAKNYDQNPETIAQLNNLQVDEELKPSQLIKIEVTRTVLNKRNQEHSDAFSKNSLINFSNFAMPVNGKLIVKFGEATKYGKSNGINIKAEQGREVFSTTEGIVIYIGNDIRFGLLMLVKVDNKHIAYAHMNDLTKEKGERVKKGELIGHVGSTGQVDTPQLYLAIKEDNRYIDPLKYLPQYK